MKLFYTYDYGCHEFKFVTTVTVIISIYNEILKHKISNKSFSRWRSLFIYCSPNFFSPPGPTWSIDSDWFKTLLSWQHRKVIFSFSCLLGFCVFILMRLVTSTTLRFRDFLVSGALRNPLGLADPSSCPLSAAFFHWKKTRRITSWFSNDFHLHSISDKSFENQEVIRRVFSWFDTFKRNLKHPKSNVVFLSHLLTSAFYQFVKKNSKLHVWHNRSSIQKILQQLQILRSTQGGEKKYHTFAEIRDLRKREGLRSRIKGTKSNMITVIFTFYNTT